MSSTLKYIIENSNVKTVYHGSSAKSIKKISPLYVLTKNSRAQYGPGFYLTTDIDVAKTYGDNIYKSEIKDSDYISAYSPVQKINNKTWISFFRDLMRFNKEDVFHLVVDYSYVEDVNSLNDNHVLDMIDMSKNGEIRNFMVEIFEALNNSAVLNAWNKHMKYKGFKDNKIYASLDLKLKINKI